MAEKEVKIKVIEWLMKHEKHSVVVPEVTLGHKVKMNVSGASRADIFAVNGDISIYEIKTERDTLERLENQLAMYRQVANRVSVVVAEKFIGRVMELPEDVGIYVITKRSIKKLRPPKSCDITTEAYLQYWWGLELKQIFRGYAGWHKFGIDEGLDKLRQTLNWEQIKNLTLFRLQERYRDESEFILQQLLDKNYEALFPKRSFNTDPKITPLVDIPFGIINPPR